MFSPATLLSLLPLLAPAPPRGDRPPSGPAVEAAAAADEGGGNVRFGPNWAAGTHLSYAHVVRARTVFYAGLAPAASGRVRRFAVWAGLVSEMDGYVARAYAAQSEEPFFRKECVWRSPAAWARRADWRAAVGSMGGFGALGPRCTTIRVRMSRGRGGRRLRSGLRGTG
jgi:hypothetical protein